MVVTTAVSGPYHGSIFKNLVMRYKFDLHSSGFFKIPLIFPAARFSCYGFEPAHRLEKSIATLIAMTNRSHSSCINQQIPTSSRENYQHFQSLIRATTQQPAQISAIINFSLDWCNSEMVAISRIFPI